MSVFEGLHHRPFPAIVGPTCSGKTAAAIAVASHLDGEIINADSRQIYRKLAVGTARPTPQETAQVPHHCLDLAEPSERFDAGKYGDVARAAYVDIVTRGKLPIIAGGSGLYIQAFLGQLFDGPGRDEAIRSKLHQRIEQGELPQLYAELRAADPVYAQRIHANDHIRIVRALEVLLATEKPLSAWHREGQQLAEQLPIRYIGLNWPRDVLYERINRRAAWMFDHGIVEETQVLLDAGVPKDAPAFGGHGYDEVIALIEGRMTKQEAIESNAKRTRNYAKRQYTWFRKAPGIVWVECGHGVDISKKIVEVAKSVLAE